MSALRIICTACDFSLSMSELDIDDLPFECPNCYVPPKPTKPVAAWPSDPGLSLKKLHALAEKQEFVDPAEFK